MYNNNSFTCIYTCTYNVLYIESKGGLHAHVVALFPGILPSHTHPAYFSVRACEGGRPGNEAMHVYSMIMTAVGTINTLQTHFSKVRADDIQDKIS